jgi:hypothetical protein
MCAEERIQEDAEEDSDADDESDWETYISEADDRSIPAYDEDSHAHWVLRKTFQMLDDGASIEAAERHVAPMPEEVIHKMRERAWRLDDGYETV